MNLRGSRPSLYILALIGTVFCAAFTPASAVAMTSPSFTIAGTAVTVPQGATTGNVSTVTVTPVGGFTGSVALTAAVTSSPANALVPPTLSFGMTTPVNITSNRAGTAALTIATTPDKGSCFTSSVAAHRTPLYAAGGTFLAGIFLLCIPTRNRRWRTMLGALAFLVALTGGMLACGGARMTVACPASTNVVMAGTTPGAYTITVTGTSGSTTATGTVSLTVNSAPPQ